MRYLFMLPPSLLIGAVHCYVWLRLVRDTRLPPQARRVATLVLASFALLYPTTFIVWFRIYSTYRWHFALVFGWLGALMYVTAALAAWDTLRFFGWLWTRARSLQPYAAPERVTPSCEPLAASELALRHDSPRMVDAVDVPTVAAVDVPTVAAVDVPTVAAVDVPTVAAVDVPTVAAVDVSTETRRAFVARVAAGGALLAGGASVAFGVRAALWDITTPEVPIALERLPRALDGYTIALLTDVHIGQTLDGRFLRHLVEQTNRMRPDAVAIGGDLVDARVFEIGPQHVSELRHLRARDGVFYVTGNHEYYWGAPGWVEFITQLGVRALINERVALGDPDRSGAQFDLAGIPDLTAGRRGEIAPDIERATAGRDRERELVVLAHQPLQVADSARAGAGLQLSGHTHGGQLNPFGAVAALSQGYVAGLYPHRTVDPSSRTQIYVSRGSGFWGPPMRVLAPAEITRIRLYRA